MKSLFYTALIFLSSSHIFAQCKSGDCKNGKGIFDFGFATYEGEFKGGEPHGKGTMDYGNGEKIVGNFENGVEHGKAFLFKKNSVQEVEYNKGVIVQKAEVFVVGGNQLKIEGCLKGDCYNGYGEIKYSSGNVYKGNFLEGMRAGNGSFYFTSGNVLIGNFVNDNPISGEFIYAGEHVKFYGTFNEATQPKTGKYVYSNFNSTVEIVDGKITKIDNPVARRADSLAKVQKTGTPCSLCGGKGFTQPPPTTTTYNSTSFHGFTTETSASGKTVLRSNESTSTITKTWPSMPVSCSECDGKGKTYYFEKVYKR